MKAEVRAKKKIEEAIESRQKVRIVIKKGDIFHMAFFLKALADLGYIKLDELSWANIARATQFKECFSKKHRNFVIEFSSIFIIGEDSIAKLAQTARLVDMI